MNNQERLIVALDRHSIKTAAQLLDELGDSAIFYKVGLELFLNTGGKILHELSTRQKKIFLDLKFHDIPNTTAAAARFTSHLQNVDMFNVHASGGSVMIQAAASAKQDHQILLAVTVLTSLDDHDISQLFGTNMNSEQLALNLALIAKKSGANGVVCSAREAHIIKEHCGPGFITVCPGIRSGNSASGDQKRTVTVKNAVKNGADYLVIGRPITEAIKPKEAVLRILDEMEE